jgi:hypothetical protein
MRLTALSRGAYYHVRPTLPRAARVLSAEVSRDRTGAAAVSALADRVELALLDARARALDRPVMPLGTSVPPRGTGGDAVDRER